MGPPIRHLTQHFRKLDTKSRLLLILSDGKPEDYDDYKGQYAIEDTRKALAEARGHGIHPYCITIDKESHDYLEHMFGQGNYTFVRDIDQLPSRMTDIYREVPPQRVAVRAEQLARGLDRYLVRNRVNP